MARPGARLGFTAWKPNPKLGELYRRFTEEPLEGREATEWGREDHVEDMLGEDFELEFSRRHALDRRRLRRGAVGALLDLGAAGDRAAGQARAGQRPRRSTARFVELYEGYRERRAGARAAPLPADARQRR